VRLIRRRTAVLLPANRLKAKMSKTSLVVYSPTQAFKTRGGLTVSLNSKAHQARRANAALTDRATEPAVTGDSATAIDATRGSAP
jgi:hypothetical protein